MPADAIELTTKVRPLIHTYGAICQLLCAEMCFEENQLEELTDLKKKTGSSFYCLESEAKES